MKTAPVTDQNKELLTTEVMASLDSLQRFAFSLTQNTHLAEELVSETVVKAFEKRAQLRDLSRVKQWLFRILHNQFISQYRRDRKMRRISLPEEVDGFSLYDRISESNFTERGNPEKSFISKLTGEKIREAINTLPPEYRITLVLCDVEDFSYAEIAAITRVPVGTVRSRIARARRLLQQYLWEYAEELGIRKSEKQKEYICTCGREEPAVKETTV